MLAALLTSALLATGTPMSAHTSVRGSIEASLSRVIPRHGPALAAQVARIIQWRGDIVRNVHPGDEIAVLFESDPEPTLLALSYRGSAIDVVAYAFADGDGVARFYDENGVLIEPRLLNPPATNYVQITEVVQSGRGKRRHKGIDFKAAEGTPVVLPFRATVNRVNWLTRTNGKCLEVVYADGTVGRFLHLHSVAEGVKAGAKLEAGTRVGAVGSTGRSSAPHLHYEIRTARGGVLDPLEVHGTERATLSASSRARFDALRHRLDEALAKPGTPPIL